MFSHESVKARGGVFFRSGRGRLAMVLLAFAAILTPVVMLMPVALDRSHAASADPDRLFARIRATSDVNSVFVTGRGYASSNAESKEAYRGPISACYTFTPAANHRNWNDLSGSEAGLKAFISEAPDLNLPQFDPGSSYTALSFPAVKCQGAVIDKISGTVTTTEIFPYKGLFDIDLLNVGSDSPPRSSPSPVSSTPMSSPAALDRSHAASADPDRLFARIRVSSDVDSVFVTGRGYASSSTVNGVEYHGNISVCFTFSPSADRRHPQDATGGKPGARVLISEAPDLDVPQFDQGSSYTALRFARKNCQGDVIGGKIPGKVTRTGGALPSRYFDIDLLNVAT